MFPIILGVIYQQTVELIYKRKPDKLKSLWQFRGVSAISIQRLNM